MSTSGSCPHAPAGGPAPRAYGCVRATRAFSPKIAPTAPGWITQTRDLLVPRKKGDRRARYPAAVASRPSAAGRLEARLLVGPETYPSVRSRRSLLSPEKACSEASPTLANHPRRMGALPLSIKTMKPFGRRSSAAPAVPARSRKRAGVPRGNPGRSRGKEDPALSVKETAPPVTWEGPCPFGQSAAPHP